MRLFIWPSASKQVVSPVAARQCKVVSAVEESSTMAQGGGGY